MSAAPPDSTPSATGPPAVLGTTRVRVHPLRMRPAGEAWIIGRVDTGDFVSVPPVAERVVTLLADGATVDEVRAALLADGADVDVAGFVVALHGLGFLSHVDGQRVRQPEPPRPTLPWLRAGHVRWLLHPATAVASGVVIVVAAVAMLLDPALVPGYQDLIWSTSGGVVVLGNAGILLVLVLLHELGHLATARAAGVPGRMSLSTRLQYLVAQTDVSGVWGEPRRTRLTVYLAGMVVNLVIAAVCVLALATVAPEGLVADLLAATMLLSLLSLPFEFLVFMRSDVYFVIQDLTGSANLYASGSAYAGYLARRLWRRVRRLAPPEDPSRGLAAAEWRAVRLYTVILVVGTVVCLGVAAVTTIPALVTVLADAVGAFAGGASTVRLFDATAVFVVLAGVQFLWARAWWRRHGRRVRALTGRWRARHPQQAKEGGAQP